MPSSSRDCHSLTSRMILSAVSRYTLLLPIELDGTAVPSFLIAVTSTTATLRWPRKPWRIQMAEWDRCMSEYSETPLLIMFRMIGSDWYGCLLYTSPSPRDGL